MHDVSFTTKFSELVSLESVSELESVLLVVEQVARLVRSGLGRNRKLMH